MIECFNESHNRHVLLIKNICTGNHLVRTESCNHFLYFIVHIFRAILSTLYSYKHSLKKEADFVHSLKKEADCVKLHLKYIMHALVQEVTTHS